MEKYQKTLNYKASKRWKLHTIYSNELGVNATVLEVENIPGTNHTICEAVLVFKGKVK